MTPTENKPTAPKKRRTPAMVVGARVAAWLRDLIATWCTARGGTCRPQRGTYGDGSVKGGTWRVPTKYGMWYVHEPSDPVGDYITINTRFEQPSRAVPAQLVGYNAYSGKWNHGMPVATAVAALFTVFTGQAKNLFDYRCKTCAQLEDVDHRGLIVDHNDCAGSGQAPANTHFPGDVSPGMRVTVDYWRVERSGRKWVIHALTDWAGLTMEATHTPPSFVRKRDAQTWLTESLASHLKVKG